MSYLDKLLAGVEVEWKPLGEVSELDRGKTITAKTKSAGTIPVISGGQALLNLSDIRVVHLNLFVNYESKIDYSVKNERHILYSKQTDLA